MAGEVSEGFAQRGRLAVLGQTIDIQAELLHGKTGGALLDFVRITEVPVESRVRAVRK